MPALKHSTLAAALATSLCAVGAQAQTALTPDRGAAAVIVPDNVDTILIVTPDAAAAPNSEPMTRAEVKAEARAAVRNGGLPRGELTWDEQAMQRRSSPQMETVEPEPRR